MGCATIKEHNQTSRPLDERAPYHEMNKRLWRREVVVEFKDGHLKKCPDLSVAHKETTCYGLKGNLLYTWPTSKVSRVLKSRTASGVILGSLAGVTIGNSIVYLRHRDAGNDPGWESIGIPYEIGLATVGGILAGSIIGKQLTRNKEKVLYDLEAFRSQ